MSLHTVKSTPHKMLRITIMNPKGGSGKSMLATNIAAQFAELGESTTLIDYDPQNSSLHWLKKRDESLTTIHGINACETSSTYTKSWLMRIPPETTRVIVDTPARINGNEIAEFISKTDIIIIPIVASEADIHASAKFVSDLLLNYKIRNSDVNICVVASRIRQRTKILKKLEAFLGHIKFPLVAKITDTQKYVQAFEIGSGMHEMHAPTAIEKELGEWDALLEWINIANDRKTHKQISNETF